MKLYAYLRNKRKEKRLSQSSEYQYFLQNRDLLNRLPKYSFLHNPQNEFEMMKGNIIIRSFKNKVKIEETLTNLFVYAKENNVEVNREYVEDKLNELIIDLPYFRDESTRIYIAFFPRILNIIYTKDVEKLLTPPYNELKDNFLSSMVDPFDTYGFDLYGSLFTKLIKIKDNGKICAYYHIDYKTIYFVNDEGRLDASVALFDKYMRRPSENHIINRITPVIDSFFNNNKKEFINKLLENNLISTKMYKNILKRDNRVLKKREKWTR